jgi:single-strand DNA-binding protein
MIMKIKGEATAESAASVNEVIVGGRVSGAPEQRELPSGDTVVQLRLVVPRPVSRPGAGRGGATVDTIDVACWTKALQRKAVRFKPGPASRYEVEASALERHVPAPPSV